MFFRFAVLLAALLVLAACGEGMDAVGIDDAPEVTDAPTERPEPEPATEEPEPEPEPTDDLEEPAVEEDAAEELVADSDDGVGRLHRLDSPVVYDEAGVSFEVEAIQITSREEAVEAAGDDVEIWLDDDTESIVAVKATLTNSTGETINFYPNQGTLQVGSEQRDAAVFLSDDVGGSDIFDGTRQEGNIFWEFRTSADELDAVGSARLVVGAPHSAETFELFAPDVDLTLPW